MKKKTTWTLLCAVGMLTACDSNFDLSNIDKEAQFSVNELVVPLNLEDVMLDPILDLDENSKVQKVVINNKKMYAVQETGTFSSDAITVEGFSTKPIDPQTGGGHCVQTASGSKEYILVNETEGSTSYTANNIDPAIKSIDNIGLENAEVSITVSFYRMPNYASQITAKNIVVSVMKGMEATVEGATYDPKTGLVTVNNDVVLTGDMNLTLTLKVTKLDASIGTYDYDNHSYTLTCSSKLESGSVVIDKLLPGISYPDVAAFRQTTTMGAARATSYSGEIEYPIEGIEQKQIDLTDIPELLQDKETHLELDNPQLYISINNPLQEASYDVKAQCGLKLTSCWTSPTLEKLIKTGEDDIQLTKPQNKIVIAPKDPGADRYPAEGTDYSDAAFVQFTDLGKVFDGPGIPQTVKVDVINPLIPRQKIIDLKLPATFNKTEGQWTFFAPLAMTSNSKVIYNKEWNIDEEELANVTLDAATVTCEMSSDVPADLDVTVVLKGKSASGQPTTMTGTTQLAANAQNQPITIVLNGGPVSDFRNIDLTANIRGTGESLTPDQKISVKNLRVKVTGKYNKVLD